MIALDTPAPERSDMFKTIRARFSRGLIEPLEELDLIDGEEIIITVTKATSKAAANDAFERAAGSWEGLVDTEALLRDLKESRKIRGPEIHL